MNQRHLCLLLLLCAFAYGQENRTALRGEIKKDSIFLEDVHVINKTSRKGTISNRLGQFEISVRESDTLIISDIQFVNQIIIVDRELVRKGFLEIRLEDLNNELDEVIVRQYDDMSEELGLPNAGKKPLNKLDRNLNQYSQKSTPMVILETLLFKPGGIDDLYNIISGNRKRDRKLKALLEQDAQEARNKTKVEQLREQFQDEFFERDAQIPKEHINNYIRFCLSKGIGALYDKGRLLEVIDIFLKNREAYFESLQE